MYADVSVEIYIVSPRDIRPAFERDTYTFMLSEDAPTGTNANLANFFVS